MITVIPAEKGETKSLFSENNIEYNERSGCTVARDGQEILGYCLYYIDDKTMTVCALSPQDDLLLADGVLRSALHIAAVRGIADIRYTENAPNEVFCRLGFVENAAERTLDISLLFKDCGGCGKT